jgi:diguanylate cyclase (GGDEF)-like protein
MRLTDEFTSRRDSSVDARFPVAWVVVGLVGALLSIFQLDRLTGEAPVQHLYYLPILLAAVYLGHRWGLAVATAAIVLYHLARPAPRDWPVRESDLVQIALFIAVAVVTARLADDAQRLRQLAATDDLTGLHNLRSFEARVTPMVRACRMAGLPIAMLVLDLDRLKSLNDAHGHLAGGEAVRTLGLVLAARLPPDAVACRFGGDEFAVAVPDCTTVWAEAIADDIRVAVKALAPELAGESFPAGTLSVSVGVACLLFASDDAVPSPDVPDAATSEALFRAANRSLYSAKEQGRDRVSLVALSTAAITGSL